MPQNNEGSRRLRIALAKPPIPNTQARLAAHLGISKTAIGYWCSGRERPSRRHRLELAILYRIPESLWDRPPFKNSPPPPSPAAKRAAPPGSTRKTPRPQHENHGGTAGTAERPARPNSSARDPYL